MSVMNQSLLCNSCLLVDTYSCLFTLCHNCSNIDVFPHETDIRKKTVVSLIRPRVYSITTGIREHNAYIVC